MRLQLQTARLAERTACIVASTMGRRLDVHTPTASVPPMLSVRRVSASGTPSYHSDAKSTSPPAACSTAVARCTHAPRGVSCVSDPHTPRRVRMRARSLTFRAAIQAGECAAESTP